MSSTEECQTDVIYEIRGIGTIKFEFPVIEVRSLKRFNIVLIRVTRYHKQLLITEKRLSILAEQPLIFSRDELIIEVYQQSH